MSSLLRICIVALLFGVVALQTTPQLSAQSEDRWSSTMLRDVGVRALAVHPTNPHQIVAAGLAALPYVASSSDGGASWEVTSLPQMSNEITAIAFAPSQPTIVYAGQLDGGVRRSTNGGRTWELVSQVRTRSTSVYGLAVHPTDPNLVFVAADGSDVGVSVGGIFRSTDGGATWAPRVSGLAGDIGRDIIFAPGSTPALYAAMGSVSGAQGGIFVSVDNGETWTPTGLAERYISDLAIGAGSPPVLAASGGGLFVSTNGGASWQRRDGVGPIFIAAHPTEAGRLFIGPGPNNWPLAVSDDYGATWRRDDAGLPESISRPGFSVLLSVATLGFSTDGRQQYLGTNGGVFTRPGVEPPVFSEEPLNQRVRPGTSVTLDAIAGGGGGPYSYQWYRGERGDTSQPISGATGRVYTTPPLSSDTAFWVRLSNPAGSADSRTARVSIKGPYDVALDGFSFRNDYRYTPGQAINGASWDIFKRTFPATNMELPGGTPRFGALRVFQSDQYQQIGAGSCAGFSAISMLRYLDVHETVERQLLNPYYRRFTQVADLPQIVAGDVPVGRSNVKDYLFLYQGRQLSIQWGAWLSRHARDTPAQTFDAVRQITEAGNVALMAYWDQESGHASVAYRTEQAGSIGYIYIYDPNWPQDSTRRITVDLGANRWLYELWPGMTWSGSRNLLYVPVSMLFPAALHLPEPRPAALATDDSGITIAVEGTVDLLITDGDGRQIGPGAIEPTQEISGAARLVQLSFNPNQPDARSPEAYYLPAGQTYTVSVQLPEGVTSLATSEPYTITALGDGSALTIGGASVTGDQPDTLRLDGSVRDSLFTPAVDGDYCQALTDEVSDVNSREYRSCVSDGAGVAARFALGTDGAYSIENVGTRPITAAVSTDQVGAFTGSDTVVGLVPPGGEVAAPEPLARIHLSLLAR